MSIIFFLFSRANAIDSAVKNATPLSQEEKAALEKKLDGLYPERTALLKPLPYERPAAGFDLNAEAAILFDQESGRILYQKNADIATPPASMTKLFLIACVLEKIRREKDGDSHDEK